ncbi:Na/Pi cotransporter family protein [Aliikangiella marina]|uniref:Na/Pi cotransporter family protein n=1 Tax=Aliikangiella marina TaxID=1712262 RepID=A0A545T4N0_9GAMM|nr:Na/Pi cotransporter family protein [Aliikangiella marina]TQV72174.1 Na/Pi cotransporter family protein [Aliikangiella marina]
MSWISFLNLIGALGLFLYGMKVMSDALMSIAGHKMRTLMVKLTSNRFKGVLTGLTITGLIQSSSATTLMVVSFVNAQLLSLTEAIGVIMGANIGTTLTAWLITLLGFKVKISAMAIPLMIVGFVLYISKVKKRHDIGKFIVGFALLFIGLQFMKDAIPNLEQSPAIYEFFQASSDKGFGGILLFVLIGTILTLILQSSSATMAITLVAAAQGLLSFEAAAAIVLGENIGTTITANMAALIAGTQAKRTAAAHFLFNIIGVIWVLLFFYYFLDLVSLVAGYFQGAQPMNNPTDIPIGLSIFHTSFNIINTVLLLGFVSVIANLVTRLIPEKPQEIIEFSKPKFLKKNFLKYPETAIHVLLRETRRLYRKTVFEAVTHALNLHREDVISSLSPQQVVKQSSQKIPIEIHSFIGLKIKPIYSAILDYASKIQERLELNDEQWDLVYRLKITVRDILHILQNAARFRHEMKKYADSDNEAMKREIDYMREQVVILMRGYHDWKPNSSLKKRKRFIKSIKRQARIQDSELLTRVDGLIRSEAITPEMGAALINCSSFILHMTERLNAAVKTLSYVADEYDEIGQVLLEKTHYHESISA